MHPETVCDSTCICVCASVVNKQINKHNAAFIAAANPETILKLIKVVEGMEKFIKSIVRNPEYEGIHGCTYGDTKYDSIAAAYGYNDLLQAIKPDAEKALASFEALKS